MTDRHPTRDDVMRVLSGEPSPVPDDLDKMSRDLLIVADGFDRIGRFLDHLTIFGFDLDDVSAAVRRIAARLDADQPGVTIGENEVENSIDMR